jgi:hypothetical protein
MFALSRLSTSLTKHGAHKVAWLINEFDPDIVLSKLGGSVPGINIELAQAKKNLSVGHDGSVPEVWRLAKSKGPESIKALTLVAIIFSHADLIEAMRRGALSKFSGQVKRGDVLDGKAFTNFAHVIEELGYSTRHTPNYIDFDLTRLFKIPEFNSLVSRLLSLKMKTAGWDGKGDINELLVSNNFHEVFATEKAQFASWLQAGNLNETLGTLEDSDYFLDTDSEAPLGEYKFRSGHREKKTGSVTFNSPISSKTASLIHNLVQNRFYAQLARKYGTACVGCEVRTGAGTSIDVVVETKDFRCFYEIKVANTVKACIRQAIPQLLEYAYWSSKRVPVDKLVIVSTLPLTQVAAEYLDRLRNEFKLPLSYEQFVDE